MIGGRLFGVTITDRYAATDLIDNPVMALEYIKRNQNWQDNGGAPLIRTGSADGSFDDTGLDEVKALNIARQIQNESEQWTDALSKSLCEAFYLVSRQDSEGYECVDYILKTTTPTDVVTIADIIPGSIGRIEEPRAENIFIEPHINYAYDYASEKFTHHIRVEGVSDNYEWDSDLTPGFQGNDGEEVWNICRGIYLRYGRFERVPPVISDQYWIPDYDTALWKIRKVVDWQGRRRFSFSVLYEQARTWFSGKQILINFPNETNNSDVRAVITRCVKNKSQNKVDLGLVLLGSIPTEFYFTMYQDSDDALSVWQETDGAETVVQEAG